MENQRRLEQLAGLLFITATVTSSVGFILLDPILDEVAVLEGVAANEYQVIIAAFLLMANAVAVVIIPVLLFPTFVKHNPHLARLYPGARIVESVVLVVGVMGLLALLTLSRDLATGPEAVAQRAAADAMVALFDWGELLGILFFFALAGLLLNYLLFRTRLVPRWLSVWGLVSVSLLPIQGALEAFDVGGVAIMALPFAVQEMVFALWLIFKGFTNGE